MRLSYLSCAVDDDNSRDPRSIGKIEQVHKLGFPKYFLDEAVLVTHKLPNTRQFQRIKYRKIIVSCLDVANAQIDRAIEYRKAESSEVPRHSCSPGQRCFRQIFED